MSQTATTAATLPNPVCVTAFIAPQSLIELSLYTDGTKAAAEGEAVAPAVISVGTYMSDRSIWHICNFTNAANALNYAFMLKEENCPISKNAFSFLQAEIKRTGAVSTRAQKAAEAKAKEATPEIITTTVKTGSVAITPMMKQYEEMKQKHPDAILLFRIGDFYETFAEDAVAAAEILGITLTRRANGKNKSIELAGFPHHALDTYLPKLVRAGKRVAICEQLKEPAKQKKVAKKAE